MSYSGEIPPLSLSFRERENRRKEGRKECSARFFPRRLSLPLASLQMSARIDVNSLERAVLNAFQAVCLQFNPFEGLSFYGRHLSKYFRGPYLPSANATPLSSHITIPLSIWIANAKSRPACRPTLLSSPLLSVHLQTCPLKTWMHPIADAVAITSRNYGQLSPSNWFSPRMGSTAGMG